MRTFSCTSIQDASNLPWVFELPSISTAIPVWGVNVLPLPKFTAYDSEGGGIGNPISYTWEALLDPADTPLPDWITETTPVPPPLEEVAP